ALLASIIDSSDDAIISKNLDGIITSWNRGAENIFGYRPHEVIGKHISIIIPLSKLHEESMIIQKIRNGERISHFETIRRTKQGNSINISLTVSPVKDSSGKIIGASKIARDITEKIELEQQKNLYTQRLHELNNYKDEFMAMASHELKTPLTVLKANLQVLDVMVIEDKQKSFLNKALIQLDKIANLMTDLLDVSKMQSGVLELNITEFNLVELFSDVINNVQLTSKEHKIVFKKSHKCLLLKADKERIEQVIINILTNAIKYSPEAKRVQVAILANEKEVIAEVTDSGIGIPNEDIENIFTRFFRVRGVASTFSGSGIGLYISNEIIKRHGGKMWVKSSFGQGSTFYFSLPHSYPEGLNYASKGRYPMKRTL
ncbi:MAG: sensor histidine kinase, partial [Ginsengibacter sp.]